MFDIGFFELLVIAVVGLVIVGPERLPGAIRTCALWWGRIKRSMRETREELERQIGADDIRRELHNEEVMRSLEALRKSGRELENELKETTDKARTPAQADEAEQGSSDTSTEKAATDAPAQPEDDKRG